MARQFTGAWRLFRLALRRDRVKLLITFISIGLFITLLVNGTSQVFSSDAEMKQGIAFIAANPAMRLFGLPTGDTYGNLLMLRAFSMLAILVGLISTFLVVRHTRQNEELGRLELLGSAIVGRHATLTSALSLAVLSNIVITALFFIGLQLGDVSTSGAFMMAAALGLTGIVFSGITAVAIQLMQSSRGANTLAATTVLGAFLISGIASTLGQLKPNGVEVDPSWLIWLSPIGWGQLMEPFTGQNWNIAALFVGLFVLTIAVAVILTNRRDVGSSIFPARSGSSSASAGLLTAMGLTWRLHRTTFIGWLVGIGVLGMIYGIVARDAEDMFTQAEGIAEIFISSTGADELLLAYFGSIASIIGVFILAYAVSVMLRVHKEEDRALEPLLSSSLSRRKWLATNVGFVLASCLVIATFAGLTVGLTAELLLDGFDGLVWEMIAGVVLQLPAVAVVVGFVMAVFGLLPRFTTALAWTALVVAIMVGPFVSSLLDLPDNFANISPMTHSPVVPPAGDIAYTSVTVLVLVALALLAVGFWGFSRRDIETK